jgi:hypothetical protein
VIFADFAAPKSFVLDIYNLPEFIVAQVGLGAFSLILIILARMREKLMKSGL